MSKLLARNEEELKGQYIQNALEFVQAKEKKTIQLWETFLNNFHKDARADTVSLEIIRTASDTVALTAAYSLRMVCRKRLVPDQLSLGMLQAIVDFQNKRLRNHQPVFIQLCLAYSATLALSFVHQCQELAGQGVALNTELYLQIFSQALNTMNQYGLTKDNQLAIIGYIPEHCIINDLKHGIDFQGVQKQTILEQFQLAILSVTPYLVKDLFDPYLTSILPTPQELCLITQYGGSYHRLMSTVAVHWLKFNEQVMQQLLTLLLEETENKAKEKKTFHKQQLSKQAPIHHDSLVLVNNQTISTLLIGLLSWLDSEMINSLFLAMEYFFQPAVVVEYEEELAALIGYVSEGIVHLCEALLMLAQLLSSNVKLSQEYDEALIIKLWDGTIQIFQRFVRLLTTITSNPHNNNSNDDNDSSNTVVSTLQSLTYYTNLSMLLAESIVPLVHVFHCLLPLLHVMSSSSAAANYNNMFLLKQKELIVVMHSFFIPFEQHLALITSFGLQSFSPQPDGNYLEEEEQCAERLEMLHHVRDMMSTYLTIWLEYGKLTVVFAATTTNAQLTLPINFLWTAIRFSIQCSEYESSFPLSLSSNNNNNNRLEIVSQCNVMQHYLEEMAEYRCHVRDFLRDVINAQPIVMKYLLCFTKDVVTEYATQLTTVSWMQVEAILHGFSAICKETLQELQQAQDQEGYVVVEQLLVTLLSSPRCHTQRAICRIGLLPAWECITHCLEQQLLQLQQPQHLMILQSFVMLLLKTLQYEEDYLTSFQTSAAAFSLTSVNQLEEGYYLPFCLKQDHIGAVVIYKVWVYAVEHQATCGLFTFFTQTNSLLSLTVKMLHFLQQETNNQQSTALDMIDWYAKFQMQQQPIASTATFFSQCLEYLFLQLLLGPHNRTRRVISWPSFTVFFQSIIQVLQKEFIREQINNISQQESTEGFSHVLYLVLAPTVLGSVKLLRNLNEEMKQSKYQEILSLLVRNTTNSFFPAVAVHQQQEAQVMAAEMWSQLSNYFARFSTLQIMFSLMHEIVEGLAVAMVCTIPATTSSLLKSFALLEVLITWLLTIIASPESSSFTLFSEVELHLIEQLFQQLGKYLIQVMNTGVLNQSSLSIVYRLVDVLVIGYLQYVQTLLAVYRLAMNNNSNALQLQQQGISSSSTATFLAPASTIIELLLHCTSYELTELEEGGDNINTLSQQKHQQSLQTLQTRQYEVMESISTLGIQLVSQEHQQQQNNHQSLSSLNNHYTTQKEMNCFQIGLSRDSKSQQRKEQELSRFQNISFLLQFWCMTCSSSSTKMRIKQQPKEKKEEVYYWQLWSWNVIQSMIEYLYSNLAQQGEGGERACRFHRMQVTASVWKTILVLLKALSGGIYLTDNNNNNNGSTSSALTEVTIQSLIDSKAPCPAQPAGHPALMTLFFTNTQHIQKLFQCLVASVYFHALPSLLREDSVWLTCHWFFIFGANFAAQCIFDSLQVYCPSVFGQQVDQSKARIVGMQLHTAALSGDWKRFRSVLKTLAK